MYSTDVLSPSNVSSDKPIAVNVIPTEATSRGSILSDNFPANGEKSAITSGCDTKIKPVFCGLNPLIYCK